MERRLRNRLMRSSSVIAVAIALGNASAGAQTLSVLHNAVTVGNAAVAQRYPTGAPINQTRQGSLNPSNAAHMAGAQIRALQYQSRVTQAASMAADAQAAARAAAAALNPGVPDGLAPGGLVPVPDPVSAAKDDTGLHTWDGAEQPMQETEDGGKVKVTVHQTQSRAILSWETFNVGKNTDLYFDQSVNGVDQSGWVALNRVVGQLDPITGLRDPNAVPAPSQILGSIHAPGTVMVLNQNGVIFTGTSQINTNSFIATSLEIGRSIDSASGQRLDIKQRNAEFLDFGFLGYADQNPLDFHAYTFSAQASLDSQGIDAVEGAIDVQAGAQITSGTGGYILLTGPKVTNSGTLTSTAGQVSLQSGRYIKLTRSTGEADENPDVRGFTAFSTNGDDKDTRDYVFNDVNAIVNSAQGYLSLGATDHGAAIEQGLLEASTSVSRNGFIQITGADIRIGGMATLAINPDSGKATIPQDPRSIADFRPSKISIGSDASRIEVDGGAMIYAPGGDVGIGALPGLAASDDGANPGDSRIFIDSGAIIDVAGLTDVLIPASRNQILIDPVKGNELRDDPNYRDSFLNGALVMVDPRLSGVDENGVAWVGSPLIEAKSFAEQVGVKVQELMTAGGNVSLGVQSHKAGTDATLAPDITVKSGAVIDVSGGWVTYEGGFVQTTQLITKGGQIIDIGNADIFGSYVGINSGFTRKQPRWGVSENWGSWILQGGHYEGTYNEGRDAGSVTLKSSSLVLDGTLYGDAYAGPRQISDGNLGTASSSVYQDFRKLQGAPSQMPTGGFLFVQGLSGDPNSRTQPLFGAGDIEVVSGANYRPVDSALGYGQSVTIDADGNLVVPTRDPGSLLPTDRQQTISLNADALSGFNMNALTLETSGKVTVDVDANLALGPGGIFSAVAGRTLTVDGTISVPSGLIQLQTINSGQQGSVFQPSDAELGSYDIVVNGTLSTRGRWVNDFGADTDHTEGDLFTGGGSVVMIAAPRQALFHETEVVGDEGPDTNTDISGSILLNQSGVIDVSSGGYVSTKGKLDLTARGGNLSLIEETTYFQLAQDTTETAGGIPGFRVNGFNFGDPPDLIPVNPDKINARVALEGTILAAGFGGGGTFTLVTPEIQLGDGTADTGTMLDLGFFSRTGFANFDITSYKTALLPNQFDNGLGGYNALLATQTLTIGDGQVLDLTQSVYSPIITGAQTEALQNLASGGDITTIVGAGVPTDAWDARAVNLTLGGLVELEVAQGGSIIGAAGSSITASKILNEGNIRIAGGRLTQSEALPAMYAADSTIAVHDLSQAFTINADGTIHEDDPNALGLTEGGVLLTNAQVAARFGFYLLGKLEAKDGVVLKPGSVTDLSGAALVNPRATGPQYIQDFRDGRLIDGGTLETVAGLDTGDGTFRTPFGQSDYYGAENPNSVIVPEQLTAEAGSLIDLSGVSETFDRLGVGGVFGPMQLWSNGGTLAMANGGTLAGATIKADGGGPHALGGTLLVGVGREKTDEGLVDVMPTLVQSDEDATGFDIVSADMIEASGFDTLVAQGGLTSVGDVHLDLGRAMFVTSRPWDGQAKLADTATRDKYAPVISSGGVLEVDAPYIRLDSALQNVSTPLVGMPGENSVIFKADEIDVSGAVLFDQSVADVELDATGDVRLSGVQPWQVVFNQDPETVDPSLVGQLAVNGNLSITAGQVFPTTGSTFTVTSAAEDGTITFARAAGPVPATPYSAGGNLLVQAANIVQGGDIRVPIGSLTLGASDPFTLTTDGQTVQFAPGTTSLEVLAGSITSVSADGMLIPYGTTTDQIEWFFAATGADELKAPPQAILTMGGANVKIDDGATVDVSGGGDLYAYEFISGTGGSHDVLDRFNDDEFSSNDGFQYPDGRQVYAIVPSLSKTVPSQMGYGQAALYDPIYSANYGDLYSAQAAGKQVYLSNVPGLAPGWYTLLPAKYATLPGGMRVVENTGAPNVTPGSYSKLNDGSYIVTGYYGFAGTGDYESTLRSFTVQTQAVFNKYSNISLISANAKFANDAIHDGHDAPPLPVDAGRLELAPSESLEIDATLKADPGKGGRGAEVDISGAAFEIVSERTEGGSPDGAIQLSADELTNLHAASLVIGGTRTDNADGTTTLDITADSIVVSNDAEHPLEGPEVVLAADGSGAGITLADGATILATGTATNVRTGDYIIDGSGDMTGQGALLRVAEGPQRQVTRENIDAETDGGFLDIGAADLEGASLLLDSSGDLTAATGLVLKTDALALGAGQVTFTQDAGDTSGLVITPELQALLADIKEVSIRTPGAIDFSSGTYSFNDLTIDTPGFALIDGDAVTINADKLTIANSGSSADSCGGEGAPACGTGDLTLNASEIDFASGTLRTWGFGGSTSLIASTGIFAGGDSTFDVGAASLVMQTPFIGDRAEPVDPGETQTIASLSLMTTGAIDISNPTGAAAGDVQGAPGAVISIDGGSVDITGTTIRATAGTLDIQSDTSITVGDGAVLATPGYQKNFGDAADPFIVYAPGGLVELTALDGDIDLQAGSTVSVGGGKGTAGTMKFTAAKGAVGFDGTLDATAPNGGGSFVLDQESAFDLSSFAEQFGDEFAGTVAVRTATGDLVLGAGDTLKAGGVMLTADGGLIDLFGTIDVSGKVGGGVRLFGLSGVTLESGSLIDAHADGFGLHDTRRAHGGDVEIGTDGDGIITMRAGAVIDVSATADGDRLVPIKHNGKTYYLYVAGDVGGTVDFRAPLIESDDGDDVNVLYNGTDQSIVGASSIVVQAFKRFDLAEIAANPDFVGVTINEDGQAVLDVGADAGAGQLNWLADLGAGTLVDFIQNFDISAADAHLGALTGMDAFHERPGMELDYSGDIILASNWNLGAGTVNLDDAVAAGDMAILDSTGDYYVLPGKEEDILEHYTTMTYRTDHGSVFGEPGVLTIRAGGNLDIKGSITDGFFLFHDQTDPDYLNMMLGGGDKLYTPYLVTGCINGTCDQVGDWHMVDGSTPDGAYVLIAVPGKDGLNAKLFDPAPYNAAANAPDAAGAFDDGSGDPLGSAELFPLIKDQNGVTHVMNSFSYQLVGGADLTGSLLGGPSVDPMRTLPGASGEVVVEGEKSYTYVADKLTSSSTFGDQLFMSVGSDLVTPDDWYDAFVKANPGLDENAFTFINFGQAPSDFSQFIQDQIPVFFADDPDGYQILSSGSKVSGVTTSLQLAAEFMAQVVAPGFSDFKDEYKPPKPTVITKPTTAVYRTLVRTGTGDIQMAAATDIDLTNGPVVYRDLDGNIADPEDGGLQVGGTTVYTAGHAVDTAAFTFTDAISGDLVAIDPAGFDLGTDFIDDQPIDGYRYGAGGNPSDKGNGLTGVLIADPIFAEGGGSVTLDAGRDVLSRRDVWGQARLVAYYDVLASYGYDWIGTPDQQWRMGDIGNASVAWINPQLFSEGVGALGGGDIAVHAGRDVSDLTVVSDTSLTTANVTASEFDPTFGLWTFGGGNVVVDAGRDILGGRFDIATGLGDIEVGRDIVSDGIIQVSDKGKTQDNTLRLRLTDAFVTVSARGDIDIQGISALGVGGPSGDITGNLDSHGFYTDIAGVSLIADGSLAIRNLGADVITESDFSTDNTPAAVYPGTLEATAITGDLDIDTSGSGHAVSVFLMPSPVGELQLVSGGNIHPLIIAQDDGDPGLLPGIFSIFAADATGVTAGRTFLFPGVLPNMTDVEREALHNSDPTHQDDPVPNRIYAGGDILDMIVNVAKQTRIGAGRDLVNMMFFGQNLNADDITRIVAGRDIAATTTLVEPVLGLDENGQEVFGEPEAAVQGNAFVIGGPGAFFLEAGRDAGPFLNSAVTDGLASSVGGDTKTGPLVYAGGIQSVGNDWNPWLGAKGADLYVEFGVGPGQNFDGLRDYYLDPANLGNLDGDLFEQVEDSNGNLVPDRDKPVYAPILIKWLQGHQAALLQQLYGTTDIDFQQAFDAFKTLPELVQRVFLLGSVYFNELIQTSIPDGPSFKQYARGYQAVNLLFPSDYGYTANDLTGGSNGANETIETGNLDLRLAAIETARGGNIYLLGPGGRVLAGSTVRTSEQAARRTYEGGRLFTGNTAFGPLPAAITEIPTGYEGILTLRGGSIYTFTDVDFLLNQSRLFTEQGGDIAMWSSNGDLNAGQGPKTSANFPPVVVSVDQDLVSEVDSVGGVSGAGIAAFEPAPGEPAPSVFLIAPRGTVDAGDAGVRVAGDLFIAAQTVANAENFSVSGTSSGIPAEAAVDVAAQTAGSSTAAAAEQEAQTMAGARNATSPASIVTVELLGIDDDSNDGDDDEKKKKKKKGQSGT
ncbi:MAG TPA: filamentous hemagglutinin family protein [Rhizomicrobium sp.]|nr:filamentous hemagglutinin family protein [Rhizomicrobium sp.]